jgi:VWFA-related protein
MASIVCLLAASTCAQQEAPTFRIESLLVEIYATVFDHQGHYEDGLSAKDFQVLENGEPQSIKYFETTAEPLHCAILLDTTASMVDTLPSLKSGVSTLIDQLGSNDSVAVFSFNEKVVTQQDFTTDKIAAKRAVLRLRAGGRTALFDAVAEVSRDLNDQSGKKAIVLFTDGDDNSSMLTAQTAVTRARANSVPIFTIAEGEALESGILRRMLGEMSANTGGATFEAKNPKDMQMVFGQVSEVMRHVYMLGYQPLNPSSDGKWRTIDLKVEGLKDATIHAKSGYFPDQR